MYPARDKLQYVIKAWWKVAWQKAGKALPVFFFANEHNNTNMKPQAKKQRLLDEALVISRIIKVEVGVISRSRRLRLKPLPRPWLFWISQKPKLIIVLLYIEWILSFSLRRKMFSEFVPTLSLPQVLSFFSLSRNQQTAALPPSSIFLCLWLLVLNYFSMSCLVNEAHLEVMFSLLHWRQATQTARTLHDYP